MCRQVLHVQNITFHLRLDLITLSYSTSLGTKYLGITFFYMAMIYSKHYTPKEHGCKLQSKEIMHSKKQIEFLIAEINLAFVKTSVLKTKA